MLALALLVHAGLALSVLDDRYCGRKPPSIPPVALADRDGIELAAVGVITRHGARSTTEIVQCWGGYEVTSVDWACTRPVQQLALGGLRFALEYTGTPSPFGPRSSCATGQLLDEGRDQHRALGRALRAAYVGASASVGPALPDDLASLPASALSLRSSAIDRTIVSGEELVVALLNSSAHAAGAGVGACGAAPRPPLAWRVSTPEQEWIYPNEMRCPALSALEAAAAAAYDRDPALAIPDARLRAALKKTIGDGALASMRGNAALDCLMATYCQAGAQPGTTGLPAELPAALASEAWRGLQGFEAFLMSHDDGAWPRLAMGPLGAEILAFVQAAATSAPSSAPPPAASAAAAAAAAPRFALWSAHDTTVMPLLASLGVTDGRWAPYAANVVVEVWRSTGVVPAHKFRLLYMGADVTPKFVGCASVTGPCALGHLERALGHFALPVDKWLVECAAPPPPDLAAARLAAAAPPRAVAAPRGAWVLAALGLTAFLVLAAVGLRRGSHRVSRAAFAPWSARLLHPAAAAAAAAHDAASFQHTPSKPAPAEVGSSFERSVDLTPTRTGGA